MAKPRTPETQLKRAIKDFCALYRIEIWPILQGLGCAPGIADFLGVWHGRAIAIEAKSRRGIQSPAQQEFERRWCQSGGIYILAKSIEDLAQGLGIKTLLS